MATVRQGSLVASNLRGMVGHELVFRHYKGKTIACARPEYTTLHEPTPAQIAQHERFRQGVLYGQQAIGQPALKAIYQAEADQTAGSAFNAAVRDFLHAPKVESIDLSRYTGAAGGTITVIATDDMTVMGVHVLIERPDGTRVEDGPAVQVGDNSTWVYATTTANPPAGCKVTATATDRPGHTGTQTQTK